MVRTYPWAASYTTAAYLRLLNTYSNYRSLDDSTRTRLLTAIAELIDQRYAGTVTKSHLAVLYLARK